MQNTSVLTAVPTETKNTVFSPAVLMQDVKEGFVDTGEIQMHYVFAGDGPAVLLLHGFPEHWYSWRYQIKALADAGYCAIAPDLRGYGKTDRPEKGYDTDTLVADVGGLAKGLGFEHYTVVGHDWGGPIAWLSAMQLPGVEKLAVINGPHPGIFVQNLLTTSQIFKSWYIYMFQVPGVAERLLSRDNYGSIRAIFIDAQRRAPESISDKDVERLTSAMTAPGALKSGLQYYRQLFRQSPLKSWRKLKKVSLPVSVTWGLKDKALVPDSRAKLERWVSGPLELNYIEDAGHFAQQERPDQVNRILVNFLQQNRATAQH